MDRRQIVACVIIGLSAAGFVGCTKERPITVGSKNFTEQVILGEIVAQHLEHRLGGHVERKLNLGGTMLAHQALVRGEIDLYPEYTGTALTAVLKHPPAHNSAAAMAVVKAEYHAQFGIEWMDALGFNNTFAIVIRGEESRKSKIAKLSDAEGYSPGWNLGMGYEFQQRPDGLQGLLKTYNLPLHGSPKTMDLGLLYQALEQREVSMVAVNATDGLLSVLDVQILDDDRQYFPPYDCALAVRKESLNAHPSLHQALSELAGLVNDEAMRQMNYQVDGAHRPVREVAEHFLLDSGLLR